MIKGPLHCFHFLYIQLFLLKIKCLKTNMNLCYFYSSNLQEVITYVNFKSHLNVRMFCQFAINTPYSDNSIFKLSFQY